MPSIEEPTNARSRRTRQAVLDAARAILDEEGFDALTMAAIAERAGVTRAGVYLHFDSVPAVVAELFDHVAEVEGLEESMARVWDAPDSVAALDAWAAHLSEYHSRLLTIDRALHQAAPTDDAAAAHCEKLSQEQMDNCVRLAKWLRKEKKLARPWTASTAADMLYGLVSSESISRLTVDRGWTKRQLGKRLADLLKGSLTSAGPS